jgi:hypothetical protein
MTAARSIGRRIISADPDSDVRAGAAQPHRGPHETRPRELARSLLSLEIVPVVLLTLVSSMSACVVPVAPTFQDPIGEPNVPPFIVSATPPVGTIITSTTLVPQVTVTDQNVGDPLAYRWVIDYPPFNSNTHPLGIGHIPAPVDGVQQRVPVPLSQAPCAFNPGVGVHQLEFILADRGFDTSNSMVLDALVDSDGFVVYANWTFSCP